jgi:tetratricopeptide (TPR) repeat protein
MPTIREQLTFMEQAYRDAGIPLDVLAFAAMSVAAVMETRWPDALEFVDRALACPPTGPFDRAYFLPIKSLYLATAGRTDDAIDCAEQAVVAAIDTGSRAHHDAESILGYALAETDPERAIRHLEGVRESGRLAYGVLAMTGERALARLYAASGNLPAALTIYAEQLEPLIPELERWDLVVTCESLAVDLSRTEHHDIAAVLFGALEAPADSYQGNPLVGRFEAVAELSARLGDDHYRAFADRGRAMSPAQLREYALTEIARLVAEHAPPSRAKDGPTDPQGPLTRRPKTRPNRGGPAG